MKQPNLSAAQIKHLEMIQGIINRMGQNSFAIKTWAISLLAAFFALTGSVLTAYHSAVAAGVLFAFWWQDAYFLERERRFRALYESVRQMPSVDWCRNPFSMAVNSGGSVVAAAVSNTLRNFYGLLLIAVLIIAWVRH